MKTLLLTLTAACVGVANASPVQAFLTTADRQHLLVPSEVATPSAAAGAVIRIDPARRHQKIAGFGAALTEGSAWLIRHGMNEAQRDALMRELFTREGEGIGFEFTRLTIGASDFSRHHYSLDDMPPGQVDPELKHFSLDPERADVIPLTKQALALNPALQVMASPWSAPGWMKTGGSLVQGRLKPEFYGAFARYMVKYVEAMQAEGVPVFALTLQNEPHFEPGDYPGMRLPPAARAAIVGQHLGPLLRSKGMKTQLLEWDHNWDEPWSPMSMLADKTARQYVSGIAWHCYAGDVSAQSQVAGHFSELDVWLTECSGGDWKPHWAETLPWITRNLIIGGTRHGARGVLMWNLALDPAHGPHTGGCTDCRGVVTIDPKDGSVTRNIEYYAFGHASRFVRQGAWRVDSEGGAAGLDHVAFTNPDGGTVLIVCNSGAAAHRFTVQAPGRRFAYELPASGVVTFVW
ncbi:glycoside hydrolase family 30 protein [Roseateles saccharophilus]|uniref:Glucosylceramidase n=1 Tax=Roseateles saccharophilus TaxID=304 RepID=A0A4R3VJJ2_ROSSA|nr:glycoside hydrolase family 30 beta sandwich domain-containing protein [Roseateles saccharophilus]MDG0831192.1 glycosyl hydrolase [Roseateles saccharophilus]TCV04313.1 glucosylceramidase [Roseateles saccharophilus]